MTESHKITKYDFVINIKKFCVVAHYKNKDVIISNKFRQNIHFGFFQIIDKDMLSSERENENSKHNMTNYKDKYADNIGYHKIVDTFKYLSDHLPTILT